MKKDSTVDCLASITVRLFGPLIRCLPVSVALFFGRRLGDLLYYFDAKHKAVAYSNLKVAFGAEFSPSRLSGLTREFYRNFGQNLIEIFFIPFVNKDYVKKYITFEGKQFVDEAFRQKRGVIFVSVHAGSWELSNVICANLGFPFTLFVTQQRYPRLNKLLNSYRLRKGCKIIERQGNIRQLIEALKNNEAIGLTADQGGKNGTLVEFFGQKASMATGALKLALKHNAVILPAFYARVSGAYIKTFVEPAFELKRTGNFQEDLRQNLQRLVCVFEDYIRKHPCEYLWTYKIWKYAREKNILILSDGITGHLRQAQAVAGIVFNSFKAKGITARINTTEVKFKNKFSRYALSLASCLSGKYHCQGCLWCFKAFLKEAIYKSLIGSKPDVIISSGSSVAALNYILSRETLSKSIAIMRPSFLSVLRFDLAIIPKHDRPPKRKNVVVTEGALNLINDDYLEDESRKLTQGQGLGLNRAGFRIGLLIGGDAKGFSLKPNTVSEVIKELKSAAEKLDADILATTSRRTPKGIENILKEEFRGYARCKLLVIANEKNIPEAVGGILGLSQLVIVSPESISMISEAMNSKRYVLVFNSQGLNRRHHIFLKDCAKNKYIYLSEALDLSKRIEDIWMHRPEINTTRDNLLVREAITKVL